MSSNPSIDARASGASRQAPGAAIPYRDELDGLRAVAVLAVLGYHAGYNDFAGGFVGVDVFLVLSGYLITQQVIALQARGRFSLGAFWLRRARRLLPAMLPVLIFALCAALLLKGDAAFRDFLGHFLGAGLFVSNYVFLAEADYFAPASDTNLLLHTWSLGLEMQFYLLMPLVLIALGRFGPVTRALALAVLAAVSLGLAEYLIRNGESTRAFFGILPRFWEFAVGGIVALLPRLPALVPGFGAMVRGAGLVMILWTVGSYAGAAFPGFGALLPVLGTALILAAPDRGPDPVHWTLCSRVMRWIGLRSYAIYLVHWPLYVSVTPSAMNRSEDVLSFALVASLFLGHLIYRYVERPVREGRGFAGTREMGLGALGFAVAVIATAAVFHTGLSDRVRAGLPLLPLRDAVSGIEADRAAYMAALERMTDPPAGAEAQSLYCTYDRIGNADDMLACLERAPEDAILVIGDSHGRDALLALEAAFPAQPFVMLHQSSCVSARYFDRSWCFASLPEVLEGLAGAGRLDRVIVTSRWGYGFHVHAIDTLAQLERLGARSVVIGPGPTFELHIEALVAQAALQGEDLAERGTVPLGELAFDVAAADRDLAAVAAATGAGYMDRYSLFCGPQDCRVMMRDGSGYAFFDNQHLSLRAIAEFARDLADDPEIAALVAAPSR